MPSKLQITGFLFATLTLSGVAMAQQGGGAGGGAGGDAGGGDTSVIAVRLKDQERLRVPRPVRTSTEVAGANCITHACNEPPKRGEPVVHLVDNCGGDLRIARDRSGRAVRRVCEFNN